MRRVGVSIPLALQIVGSLSLAVLIGCTSKVQVPVVAQAHGAGASTSPCTFCPSNSQDGCTLCVRKNPLIAVGADGAGSSILRVCNESNAPITLALAMSDFVGAAVGGHAYALPSASQISAVAPAEESIVNGSAPLQPQRCVAVKVDATGLAQAGPMSSTLRNEKQEIVELKAVRQQVPFTVKIDGPTPEKLDLSIVRGRKARIVLRNEDSLAYRFVWRLEIGSDVISDEAVVLPNRLVELEVDLDPSRFDFLESGFLRSADRQGRLVLQHEPDPSFRVLPSAQRTYPVNARLHFWASTPQRIWNAASILLVLLLGIVVSLLINYALPVQRQRVGIKQRLAEQDGRLGGIGSVISSRTLNLLRVEKKRLGEELQSLWPILPATEAELSKLESRVKSLGQRIDLTANAGEVLKALEGDDSLAQQEIADAGTLCRQTLEVVEKVAPTPEDLKRAQAALDSAAVIRSTRYEKPTTEKVEELRGRGEAAKASLKFSPAPPPEWQDFENLLGGLRKDFLQQSEKDPTRDRFIDAANAVTKAEAVLEYARLIKTAGGDPVRKARLHFAEHLLKALRPGANESTADVRLLLKQIEQGVGEDEIVAAVRDNKPGVLRIEVDPSRPRRYQLVLFRVHLNSPGMDNAAAREKIKWKWMVNGEEVAVGQEWTAWYFFDRPGTVSRLKAWWEHLWQGKEPLPPFAVSAAATLLADPTTSIVELPPVHVHLEETKSYVESSTMLSLSGLGITVLLVGLGLLAGAQDKLQSLDWVSGFVAIVLLGFGADVLKRAIVKP